MHLSDGGTDHGLKQLRLSRFGLVLALIALGFAANFLLSLWLGQLSFNRSSVLLLVAAAAFGTLWLLLRAAPRSPRFVRGVELTTLFVGTAAFAGLALVMDMLANPDMLVRTLLTYMLLVYAVYVPSTAKHTLLVAGLMTPPLLGSIFVAFRSWDPALHDPPAAPWPKGQVGDMAYPATLVTAFFWAIVVAMAASFSQTIYGLRKAVSDIRRLGQYTLEEKLGEGGMGVVYRASHAMLRRPTAIKLLHPDRAGAEALARFEREVRRTAMLTHPNTVTVFDYGQTSDGVFYYAMELLEGASLQEIVEVDGAQPAERVIHLLEQAAASLSEAHDAGLIHRDIKPANVLVVDRGGIADLVKVVDFGLVKDVRNGPDADATITTTASVTGTPHYMAPESITTPDSVDARIDIYALGAVGYWLLTGTHVFRGNTVMEVLAHHLHTPPEAPSERLNVRVERDLEKVILACLAKQPGDRPQSARVLREQLRACAGAHRWNPSRAAEWWQLHRHQLRSGNLSKRRDMNSSVTKLFLAAISLIPVVALAQTPPPAPAPQGRRTFEKFTVEGEPVDRRKPELDTDHPVFPGQTRAPYHKTTDVAVTTIASDLNNPWAVQLLPSGRFLITEKAGRLRIINKDGSALHTITANMPPVLFRGQAGLLDVALDRNFATNHRIFFVYMRPVDADNCVQAIDSATLNEDAGTIADVRTIFQGTPYSIRALAQTGARIAVDPKDGNLFVALGDRSTGDPLPLQAQQPDKYLGKILHITPEGKPAPGNPSIGQPEFWTMGHRTPQGLTFAPDGRLWEVEHGPRGGDELNLIEKGKNYGWPVIVHGINYPGTKIGDAIVEKAGLEQPRYYWDPVIAPGGLAFYRGNLFPQWQRSVLVAALAGQALFRLELGKDDKVVNEEPLVMDLNARIRDVRVFGDGAVYLLTEGAAGKLVKLTPK